MEFWKNNNGVEEVEEAETVIADAVGLLDRARAIIESQKIHLDAAISAGYGPKDD